MNFIDIILQNSQAKEAKLYLPAKKANEVPETGVSIQTPAAYHVIKDCAAITLKYLPHYIFGLYANPFEVLKGKFQYNDVVEFVNAANSDMVMNQLLTLITSKIKSPGTAVPTVSPLVSPHDPYGDYDSYTPTPVQEVDTVTRICNAFSVPVLSKTK